MNLATISAAPTLLTVGDREYKVGPLRYLELGIIQRYLDGKFPAPAPQVGHDGWVKALFSDMEGLTLFLNLLFGKHRELTDDDLAHIMGLVGPNQIGTLFDIAMEQPVGTSAASEADSPPKSPAAPSTS